MLLYTKLIFGVYLTQRLDNNKDINYKKYKE